MNDKATLVAEPDNCSSLRDRDEQIASFVRRHERSLLRLARQWSLCADDAHDAFQRALEIYIKRLDTLDPKTELAWLKVVVRHEAIAIRQARQISVTGDEIDFDGQIAVGQRSIEEQFESSERIERSAEVIARLKRDEVRALLMKAEGHSYDEIGQQLGWTYTKVNRCITEGRKRFRQVYEGIENGKECDRLHPILRALVATTAAPEQLLEIRPHLRHCNRCRATLRYLHDSRSERLAALSPLPLVITIIRNVGQRWRDELAGLLHRIPPSDLPTSLQIVSGGSGNRIIGIATMVGLCFSGGTYCAVNGQIPDLSRLWKQGNQRQHRQKVNSGNALVQHQASLSGAQSAGHHKREVQPFRREPQRLQPFERLDHKRPTKRLGLTPLPAPNHAVFSPAEQTQRKAHTSTTKKTGREFAP